MGQYNTRNIILYHILIHRIHPFELNWIQCMFPWSCRQNGNISFEVKHYCKIDQNSKHRQIQSASDTQCILYFKKQGVQEENKYYQKFPTFPSQNFSTENLSLNLKCRIRLVYFALVEHILIIVYNETWNQSDGKGQNSQEQAKIK